MNKVNMKLQSEVWADIHCNLTGEVKGKVVPVLN
jgi:hypothetical protein